MGDSSSSSTESECNLKKEETTKKKRKRKRGGRRAKRFSLEVVVKSLQKLPEYFKLQYENNSASSLTEDEQRDFIYDFRTKKLWEELIFLRDKTRDRGYISKKAEEIRKKQNNNEFRKVVSEKLFELQFSRTIIKEWYPEFQETAQQQHTSPKNTSQGFLPESKHEEENISSCNSQSVLSPSRIDAVVTTAVACPAASTTTISPSHQALTTALTQSAAKTTIITSVITTPAQIIPVSPVTATTTLVPFFESSTTTTAIQSSVLAGSPPKSDLSAALTPTTTTTESASLKLEIPEKVHPDELNIQISPSPPASPQNNFNEGNIVSTASILSGTVVENNKDVNHHNLPPLPSEYESEAKIEEDTKSSNFLDSFFSCHDSDSDQSVHNSECTSEENIIEVNQNQAQNLKSTSRDLKMTDEKRDFASDNFFVDLGSQNSEHLMTSQQIILQVHGDDSSSSNGSLHNTNNPESSNSENGTKVNSDNLESSFNSIEMLFHPNDIQSNINESENSDEIKIEETDQNVISSHGNTNESSQSHPQQPFTDTFNNSGNDNNTANENTSESFDVKNNDNNINQHMSYNQTSTPIIISMFGDLIELSIDDVKTWKMIENFSIIHEKDMIRLRYELITTQSSISRQIDGVVLCIYIDHWIFIEVDLNADIILIHDPAISKTPPNLLREFLDKLEEFLDTERRPSMRQRQFLDGTEEAVKLNMNTGEFCLKLLNEGIGNLQEHEDHHSVVKTTKLAGNEKEEILSSTQKPGHKIPAHLTKEKQDKSYDESNLDFVWPAPCDDMKDLEQSEDQTSAVKATCLPLNKTESKNSVENKDKDESGQKTEPYQTQNVDDENSSLDLVWVECCEMLEETAVNCSTCKIHLHEDCAVLLGSNIEGYVYYCLSCEDVKLNEEKHFASENENKTPPKPELNKIQQIINGNQNYSNEESTTESRTQEDDCLITAKDICSILCEKNSTIDYSPPLSFPIVLTKEEVDDMFSFSHAKTDDQEEMIQVNFNINSWAGTLSEAMSRSDIPCSFSATHTPFLCRTAGPKKYESQNHSVKNNFAHCYGKCNGKCDLKFTVIFSDKPQAGRPMKVEVKTKGTFKLEQETTTARRVSGSQRSKVKEELRNSKSSKVYLDRVSHLSALHLLHKNKKSMTPGVLRTAKWEEKTEKRSDKNECRDLENILLEQKSTVYPESSLPGYLRHLTTIDNFQYEMYCWPQIKLTNILAQKTELWLTIDASSRIARRPNEEKIQKKSVFNYIMDVSVEGVQPYTLAELVTTNNTSSNIKSFMTRVLDEVKKAGQHMPKVVTGVISDMSMALIHASCETINVETFKSYIKRSYRIVNGQEKHSNKKSIILVCSNHTLAAFLRNLKKRSLDKDVRKVAAAILARIMESRDLFDFKYFARRAVRILGCQYFDEETLNTYIEEIKMKNMENFENMDEEIDILDFEYDVEEYENQNQLVQINEDEEKSPGEKQNLNSENQQQKQDLSASKNQAKIKTKDEKYSVLRSENNFYRDFVRIRKECCPELPETLNPKSIEGYLKRTKVNKKKSQNEKDVKMKNVENCTPANPYFSLKVLELLENYYIPMIPFIGAMVPRHCGFPAFLRRTNAVVESSFKINKHEWHLTRNMHNGDFIKEHFQLILGKIKDVMSNVNKNRKKLKIPLVSLKCAEGGEKKQNPGPLGKLACHEATENWGGVGDVKPKVKKEPKHLSSIEKTNENQSKRVTRSHKVEIMEVENASSCPEVTQVILGISSHGKIVDSDLHRLFKGNLWLSSDIVNEYSYILCDEYDALPLHKKCLGNLDILSSYAILKTKNGEPATNESCFHRLSDNSDTIFFPLNIDDAHWTFLKIEHIQNEKRLISIFDSKPACTSTTELMKIIQILKTAFDVKFGTKEWDDHKCIKTVNQRNSFNCGPSTLLLMDLHIHGQETKKYAARFLTEYRLEMAKKILKTSETGRLILKKCKTDDGLKCFILEKKEEMLEMQKKINSK